MGDAFIEVVGHQVKNILFQVGAGADDEVHLILADHLGEGEAQLGGAHGPRQGDHHPPPLGQVDPVAFRGIHQGRGVEVPEMMLHIAADRAQS